MSTRNRWAHFLKIYEYCSYHKRIGNADDSKVTELDSCVPFAPQFKKTGIQAGHHRAYRIQQSSICLEKSGASHASSRCCNRLLYGLNDSTCCGK